MFIITARKRSLRRLCFYTCVSVHRWGSTWAGTPPPRPGTPPGTRYTPQNQVHPPKPGTPPKTRYTSPGSSACWEIQATSGRYASYWNAFLLIQCYTSDRHGHGEVACKQTLQITKQLQFKVLKTRWFLHLDCYLYFV